MKIQMKKISVREVVAGYRDSAEEGVTGYFGKLDIRPKYQREFVYKEKQRNAVIQTIRNQFPLNVMYWMVRENGDYEVLDGQQRTISTAQYVNGDFSIENRFFHNLTKVEQKNILDYEFMIYFCEGTDRERLDWFQIINIAGEKLTDQEIRNAVYTGTWLSDAKSKFSKSNCVAYLLSIDGGHLLTGSPIRQDYLETALKWINNGAIEEYMSIHQHDETANELWNYFVSVIEWVRSVFPNYRKEMANVEWGLLFNKYSQKSLDPSLLEFRVRELMQDEEVTSKSGIFDYLLSGSERALSIRSFTEKVKREAYETQDGICPKCGNEFSINQMEADHIKLWSEGGRSTLDNCQMLCKDDHREKSRKG
jgi:hypothetical protein